MLIHNEDGKGKQGHVYSWKSGAINKAGTAAGTASTAVTAFADLFTPFTLADGIQKRKPHKITILAAGTAYFKINGGDVITVTATTPFEAEDLIIDSLSMSDNSGNVSATVYLQ